MKKVSKHIFLTNRSLCRYSHWLTKGLLARVFFQTIPWLWYWQTKYTTAINTKIQRTKRNTTELTLASCFVRHLAKKMIRPILTQNSSRSVYWAIDGHLCIVRNFKTSHIHVSLSASVFANLSLKANFATEKLTLRNTGNDTLRTYWYTMLNAVVMLLATKDQQNIATYCNSSTSDGTVHKHSWTYSTDNIHDSG